MITLYQPPRRRSSEDDSNSEVETIIPAGVPYITKINGKLVMAREKRERLGYSAVAKLEPGEKKEKSGQGKLDLLGEAFGYSTRLVRKKRSKSVDSDKTQELERVQSYPQIRQVPYAAALPQQPFPPTIQQQPVVYYQTQQQLLLGPPRPPTQTEFRQLTKIDMDFHKRTFEIHQPLKPTGSCGKCDNCHETVSKTTITITKHVCANCGRLRSRKYHQDNPIKHGEIPIAAFCRRCQRDASSTSESSKGNSLKKKKIKTKSKGKKHYKVFSTSQEARASEDDAVSQKSASSSEDEWVRSPKTKGRRKSRHQKKPKRDISSDYIIVEEEVSEEDVRGRQRSRYYEEELQRRPLPPVERRSYVRKSPPSRRRIYYESPVRRDPRHEHRRETEHRPSSPLPYRIVEGIERYPESEPSERHPRRDSRPEFEKSHRVYEEDVQEYVETSTPPRRTYHAPPERNISRRQASAEEVESMSSKHSKASSPLNQIEASRSFGGDVLPWDQPHQVNPSPGTEKVMVKEMFIYRPKKLAKNRGGHDFLDRNTASPQREIARYSEREASRYYHDDWHGRRSSDDRSEPPTRRGYRRNTYEDPELAPVSEISSDFARAYDLIHENISPPPSLHPTSTSAEPLTPYPLSSDEEVLRQPSASKTKPPYTRSRSRSRSKSRPRPAYVRQATDGGTEQALVHSPATSALVRSPGYSSARRRTGYTDDDSESSADRESRHVAFRDTVSERAWSGADREASASGFGGDHDDDDGAWGGGSRRGSEQNWAAGSGGGGGRGSEQDWARGSGVGTAW